MSRRTRAGGLVCLVVAMAVACLGLAPPSKIDALDAMLEVLRANGFEDSDDLLRALQDIDEAQAAEKMADEAKARKFYGRASIKLIRALARNENRQDEATKGANPDLERLLELARQYQWLHELFEEVMVRSSGIPVKTVPTPVKKLPAIKALQVQLNVLKKDIRADKMRGAMAQREFKDHIQEWKKYYDDLVELLEISAKEVVRIDRSGEKTTYTITLQEDLQAEEKEVTALKNRLDSFTRALNEIKPISKETLVEDGDIPELPEPMPALELLRKPLREIRDVQEKGSLGVLVREEEARSPRGKIRSKLTEETKDTLEVIEALREQCNPYVDVLEKLSSAIFRIDQENVLKNMKQELQSGTEAVDLRGEAADAAGNALLQALAAPRLDITSLIPAYKVCVEARANLRDTVEKLSSAAKTDPKTKMVLMSTRNEIKSFKDLLNEAPAIKKRLIRLKAHREKMAALEKELREITLNAMRQSFEGTEFAVQLKKKLELNKGMDLNPREYLVWYADIMADMKSFLQARYPLVEERIKKIRQEYEAAQSDLLKIKGSLRDVDENMEKLAKIEPLADKLGNLREEIQKIEKRRTVLENKLPEQANEAIERAIKVDPGEIEWKRSYRELEQSTEELFFHTDAALDHWNTFENLIDSMDKKFADSDEKKARAETICKHKLVLDKAASEMAFDVKSFREEFEKTKARWEAFKLKSYNSLLRDGVNLNMQFLIKEWTAILDDWQVNVNKVLDEFLRLYAPMGDFLKTKEGETVRHHISDINRTLGALELDAAPRLKNALEGLDRRAVHSDYGRNARDLLREKGNKLSLDIEKTIQRIKVGFDASMRKLWASVREPDILSAAEAEFKAYREMLDDLLKSVNPLIREISAFREDAPVPAAPPVQVPPVLKAPTPPVAVDLRAKIEAKIEKMMKRLDALKLPVNFSKVFCSDPENLRDLLVRLEKRGKDLLGLNPQEISELEALVAQLWKKDISAKEVKKRLGFAVGDVNKFLFSLHRVLCDFENNVVDVHSIGLDKKLMEAAGVNIQERIKAIQDREAEMGLDPSKMPVIVLQTWNPIRRETFDRGSLTVEEDVYIAGMKTDKVQRVSKKWSELIVPLLARLEERAAANMPALMPRDYEKLKGEFQMPVSVFEYTLKTVKDAAEARAKKYWETGEEKPTAAMLNEHPFNEYVMPGLIPLHPSVENLWSEAAPYQQLNYLAVPSPQVPIDTFGQGKPKDAVRLMARYYTMMVDANARVELQLLLQRLERAALENPRCIIVFFQDDMMEPLFNAKFRNKDVPDSLEDGYFKSNLLFQRLAGKKIQNLDLAYGRALVEMSLAYWTSMFLEMDAKESAKLCRDIVSGMEWEDIEAISKMYERVKGGNFALIRWLLNQNPSRLDTDARKKLLPSAGLYYALLFNQNEDPINAFIAKVAGNSDSALGIALRSMVRYDFFKSLDYDQRKDFFVRDADASGKTLSPDELARAQEEAELSPEAYAAQLASDTRVRLNSLFFGKVEEKVSAAQPGMPEWKALAIKHLMMWKASKTMSQKELIALIRYSDIMQDKSLESILEKWEQWKRQSLEEVLIALQERLKVSAAQIGVEWLVFQGAEKELFTALEESAALSQAQIMEGWRQLQVVMPPGLLSTGGRPMWEDLILLPRREGPGSAAINGEVGAAAEAGAAL